MKKLNVERVYIDPRSDIERFTLDEHGAGNLFADNFKDVLRFAVETKAWYHFNGVVWERDVAGIWVEQFASELLSYLKTLLPNEGDSGAVPSIYNNIPHDYLDKLKTFIMVLSSRKKRKTMIEEGRRVYPVSMQDFDSNPNLINCLNGTLDLSTNKLRPHSPDDLLTKKANVEYLPKEKCLRWLRFIGEITCGDSELGKYLQKALAYALTGDTSLEVFFILYGAKTRNGKGTLMETMLNITGDYSSSLSPASIAKKSISSNNPTPEFARVAGVRLVNISEPDKGLKLNVALMKRLTGGDSMIARNLFENSFEYRPQFKMFINTNHLLGIDDDTIFSSNRVKMIPFDKHFTEEERDLTLKAEFSNPKNASGILNWLIEGYTLFKKEGLEMPKRAVEALKEYRKECDTIALFVEDTLDRCDDTAWVKTSVLYGTYKSWCVDKDIESKSQKEFVATLKGKGLVERHRTDGHVVKGYKFKEDETQSNDKK
jgi:putative DNA primase/helicase